jgi:hypothetical protein
LPFPAGSAGCGPSGRLRGQGDEHSIIRNIEGLPSLVSIGNFFLDKGMNLLLPLETIFVSLGNTNVDAL